MMKKAREKALKRAVELGASNRGGYGIIWLRKERRTGRRQTEAQRLAHRDAVIEHSDNKFVAELTKIWMHSSIQRTSMLHFISELESGMTSIEAYESLGFGTTSRKSTSQTEISLLIQLLFT
ncbi:hypothetical protein [Catenibacterium sp.]|uniref:hypothetical protein n=1 Tax=Catenibacterium sp. TaxID=2049022 RepID=UPI00399396CE